MPRDTFLVLPKFYRNILPVIMSPTSRNHVLIDEGTRRNHHRREIGSFAFSPKGETVWSNGH